jgi:uncharacterized protein YjhX (UPF0386 family)
MRPPIPFAGSELGEARHVCAFFNSQDEAYRVLLPFIHDGFECGEKAVHVVNPDQRKVHLGRLEQSGIDCAVALESGQFELLNNADTYLRDGHFDQDRMLAVFETLAEKNAIEPYPFSRIVCQMDWASADQSCIEDLIQFEARVNDVWARYDDAVICVYDLAKFRADTVIDILRTHPMVVIGGILQHNPFFVAPDEFLLERRQRRAT